MKIAYIILAHKNPLQVVRLIKKLNEPQHGFFIHIDKKSERFVFDLIYEELKNYPNVTYVRRFDCRYLGRGTVQAALEGLRQAYYSEKTFDYFVNLSGQDYPIKTKNQINEKLKSNPDASYMWYLKLPHEDRHPVKGAICQRMNRVEFWHFRYKNFYLRLPDLKLRKPTLAATVKNAPLWLISKLFLPEKRKLPENLVFYGGSAWWCLNRKHSAYILEFLQRNEKFSAFFDFVFNPDELFFQTILLNSEHKDEIVNDDLRLVYFFERNTHPKTFTTDDLPTIIKSEQFFARKFDLEKDETVLDLIDEHLTKEKKSFETRVRSVSNSGF